jgi:hypothetical protein
MILENGKNFSEEERALLDEKINLIIRKYQKTRRRKAFWAVITIILSLAIVGFVGYCYYVYVNTGTLPGGLPVFWM